MEICNKRTKANALEVVIGKKWGEKAKGIQELTRWEWKGQWMDISYRHGITYMEIFESTHQYRRMRRMPTLFLFPVSIYAHPCVIHTLLILLTLLLFILNTQSNYDHAISILEMVAHLGNHKQQTKVNSRQSIDPASRTQSDPWTSGRYTHDMVPSVNIKMVTSFILSNARYISIIAIIIITTRTGVGTD